MAARRLLAVLLAGVASASAAATAAPRELQTVPAGMMASLSLTGAQYITTTAVTALVDAINANPPVIPDVSTVVDGFAISLANFTCQCRA